YFPTLQPLMKRGYVFILVGEGLGKIKRTLSHHEMDISMTAMSLQLIVCSEYVVPISTTTIADSLFKVLRSGVQIAPYLHADEDVRIVLHIVHKRAKYIGATIPADRAFYQFKGDASLVYLNLNSKDRCP